MFDFLKIMYLSILKHLCVLLFMLIFSFNNQLLACEINISDFDESPIVNGLQFVASVHKKTRYSEKGYVCLGFQNVSDQSYLIHKTWTADLFGQTVLAFLIHYKYSKTSVYVPTTDPTIFYSMPDLSTSAESVILLQPKQIIMAKYELSNWKNLIEGLSYLWPFYKITDTKNSGRRYKLFNLLNSKQKISVIYSNYIDRIYYDFLTKEQEKNHMEYNAKLWIGKIESQPLYVYDDYTK